MRWEVNGDDPPLEEDSEGEEEKELKEEFPQLQYPQMQDLLEKMCSHDCFFEDWDYQDEKRSIMQDAAPLADAWESAETLKKIFKWGRIPRHFQSVIFFLEN